MKPRASRLAPVERLAVAVSPRGAIFSFLLLCASIFLWATPSSAAAQTYDVAINHGRVIDPETGLDAIRHIGIRAGHIQAISKTPLTAPQMLNAEGMVVAPGFIDLHSHTPTPLGQHYQLFDGVTTALELEAGHYPAAEFGVGIADQPLINFGASAGYIGMRIAEKEGVLVRGTDSLPKVLSWEGIKTLWRLATQDLREALARTFTETASPKQRDALRQRLHADLDAGALGIGLALDYISEAVGDEELAMIFAVAGERDVPVFVHIRRGINGDPSGLREVLGLARRFNTPLHICHITHNAIKNIELFLAEIAQARAEGLDVTTELLPFNAGSTTISAAVFERDWRTVFGIDYSDVQWAATGEWLTEESFQRYRREQPHGMVIHHYLQEVWAERALSEPGMIVVSDALPMESIDKKVPPHNGAFTKVLGHYVRERGVISLPEAIARMSLLPAQRLQSFAPTFAHKGRLQVGADADILVFDPATVINRASYAEPYQEAAGLQHIVVNGVPLVVDGALREGVYPGRRVTAEPLLH